VSLLGFDALGGLSLGQLPSPPPSGTVPFNQVDWSKPSRIRRSSVDLSVSLNPNVFKNPIPFNQVDWARPLRVQNFFDKSVPTNPNLFKNPLPFNQVDWSKPARVQQARTDPPYPLNINLFKNPYPFNQFDFYLRPKRVPSAPFDLSRILNPNLVPYPFNQVDWSKPFRVPQARTDQPLPLNINLFSVSPPPNGPRRALLLSSASATASYWKGRS